VPRRPVFALGLLLCIYLFRQALASLLVAIAPPSLPVWGQYAAALAQEALIFGLPLLLCCRARPGLRSAVRHRRLSVGAGIGLAVAAALSVFVMNLLNAWWLLLLTRLGVPLPAAPLPVPVSRADLALALLTVGPVAALCEEWLFRGLLFHDLEGAGTAGAWLATGFLFALMHGQYTALPAHLALGLLLGGLLVGYGSLWAPMLYHAAYNGVTVLVAYRAAGMPQSEAAQAPDAAALLAALPFGTMLLSVCAALLLLPMRWVSDARALRAQAPWARGAKWLLAVLLALFILAYAGAIYRAVTPGVRQ
jgi:membrane protease YdiL (CAAX protease family)